ncbi:MAG: hypothetical protein LBT05_04645 [Planctomycetaceae bacterium]|nr:hypothetical protein [Planctomycetaceae bacterium]
MKKNILCKVCVWSFICGIVFTATTAFAQQEIQLKPDVVYTVNLTKTAELNWIKEILATTEFKNFYDALTTKIDAEYDKASKKFGFPTKLADFLLKKVREVKEKEDISSKDVLEVFADQFELIQVDAFVKKAYNDYLQQNTPSHEISGTTWVKQNIRVTFVVKFHPAELAGITEYFEDAKGKIRFELIEPDTDNFLVKFSDPNEIFSVYAGGRKIENTDTYAVVFSGDRKFVEQKLNQLQNKNIQQFLFGENAPAKWIRAEKSLFEVLKQVFQQEIQKKIDNGGAGKDAKDVIRIIEQIEQIESVDFITRDFNEKTGSQLQITLTSEKTATNLKDLAEAGKVFLTFAAGSDNVDENGKKLLNLIINAEIKQDGKILTALINWSDDTSFEMIKQGLQDTAKKLKK